MIWATSPLGRNHCLDNGVALCGRYAPEPHDIRPAPPNAERCTQCLMLLRPSQTSIAPASKSMKFAARKRNENIRNAKRESPELTLEALASRFGVRERTVLAALARQGER